MQQPRLAEFRCESFAGPAVPDQHSLTIGKHLRRPLEHRGCGEKLNHREPFSTNVMPQSGGVKRIVPAVDADATSAIASAAAAKTGPRPSDHPAGGIARLCNTRTDPTEIRAQPSQSGGRSVLRGPEELLGDIVANVAP